MDNPFETIIARLNNIEEKVSALLLSRNDNEIEPDKLMNIEEVAGYINESVATIYSRTSKRTIPFYKKGKRLMFKKNEILEWLESGKKKTIKELEDEI